MTIPEKYRDWIQADIDGELPPSERAEFSRYLLAHPEARALQDELRCICAALDKVEPAEPPADLHSRIMASLPQERFSRLARAPFGGTILRFGGTSRNAAGLRYAAAFAGGLLVSALAFQFSASHEAAELSVTELVGTMARAVPEVVDVRAGTQAHDRATIDLAGLSGTVSLHGTAAAPVVGVSIVSSRDVQIVASLESHEIRFGGFDSATGRPDVRVAAFRQGLRNAEQTIEVAILETGSGEVLQRSTLRFGADQ